MEMRFTHFLNVVKQAESEGLVSSRNYALPLLVNIGTLNTCQNKSLFCLFSNAPVSPIAGLADRVPLLTSVLPSYRRNAIAKSLKVFHVSAGGHVMLFYGLQSWETFETHGICTLGSLRPKVQTFKAWTLQFLYAEGSFLPERWHDEMINCWSTITTINMHRLPENSTGGRFLAERNEVYLDHACPTVNSILLV